MKSTITFALLFCSSTVLAQLAPSIESDGDDIVLRASGGDVKFVTQTGGTTSLQELIDVIQKLKQQVAEGDNSTVNVDTAMLEVSCTLLFFFWGRRIYRLWPFSCILFPRSPCTFPDCAQERDSSASSIIYINRLTTHYPTGISNAQPRSGGCKASFKIRLMLLQTMPLKLPQRPEPPWTAGLIRWLKTWPSRRVRWMVSVFFVSVLLESSAWCTLFLIARLLFHKCWQGPRHLRIFNMFILIYI